MKLLVATHNKGKVAGLSAMLADAGIACLSLDDAGITFDVEETETTFLGNATLKATQYAQASGMLTLADDSGLEVDALDGAPGVYTARYGGTALTTEQRNQYLLEQLAHVGELAQRTARFRCVLVLANGQGDVVASAAGICEGQIAFEPQGTHGFGYDPVFFLPDHNKTMALLESADKHIVSHRGQALRKIVPDIVKQQT